MSGSFVRNEVVKFKMGIKKKIVHRIIEFMKLTL